LNESLEVGTLIKIWTDGNQHLGKVKEIHSHPSLVHYSIIRTIYRGSDYDKYAHEEISSINNIVNNYGVLPYKEHQDLFPEDWV